MAANGGDRKKLHPKPEAQISTIRVSLERKILASFAFALIILGIIGLYSIQSIENLESDARLTRETASRVDAMKDLMAGLNDMETGQRGYLLTGQDAFLEPYLLAEPRVHSRLEELSGLSNAKALFDLADLRIAHLKRGISLRKEGNFAAAQKLISEGKGKQLHDEIRKLLHSMESVEERTLGEQIRKTSDSIDRLRVVVIGGILAAVVVVAIALYFIRRDFRARREMEKTIREQEELLDLAADAIVVKNAENRIVYWNQGAERLYGFGREEALAKDADSLLRTEPWDGWEAINWQLKENGHWEGPLRQFTRDNREILVESHWSVRKDESSGRKVLEINHDATARIEAERALRKTHEELEARVDERTVDLSDTLKRLKKSEKLLRTVTEDARVGLALVDAGQRYLFANNAHSEMLNLGRADLTGLRVQDVLPDVYEEQIRPRLERCLAGETVRYELQRHWAGPATEVRHYAVTYERQFDAGGAVHVAVVFFDITDRKRAEDAQRESEERLQTVIENLSEGLVISDLDGNLLHWNRASLEMHLMPPEQPESAALADFPSIFELKTLEGKVLPVEDWPLGRVLRGETLRDIEIQISRVGTAWRAIFSYGGAMVTEPGGRRLAFVTITDITERSRAVRALQESEENLRLERALLRGLIDSIPDLIFFKDTRSHFLGCNKAFEAYFGITERELIGKSDSLLVPEEIADFYRKMDQQVLASRKPRHNEEWIPDCRLGGGFFDTLKTPYFGPDEQLMGLIAVCRDITQRRRTEEEVRKLNADLEHRVIERTSQLEYANRELEAFSYSVSHDLRSPLRTLDGFSQAVLEDYADRLPEEGVRYLRTIREGAQRMGSLIDDLLTFSRLSRTPLSEERVNVEEMVASVLDEQQAFAMPNVQIQVGKLPACHGDAALLRQVWTNLISNALKYSQRKEPAIVEIGFGEKDGKRAYYVKDNGAGFDMRYAGKLFGVFQRLHRAEDYEGTGVGLAIVQRVIQRHGGQVWAEGVPDKGATFYFSLKPANTL
jgi:PAS domain S-box-containing protein